MRRRDWTSTYAEENGGYVPQDEDRGAQVAVREKFKIIGYTLGPAGTMQDSLEERLQSANKLGWRDAKIHKSKDVPCSVFGSEHWSWSRAISDTIKFWETQAMRRLFRFKRKEDETLKEYCVRTARATRIFGRRCSCRLYLR